jgi:type I restriction enzyme S subunit
MKNWATKKLGDVCELSAGGDVPKGNFSEIKTDYYQIPIYANGEKNEGFYGYTSKAKVTKPSITVSGRGTIGYTVKRLEPFFPIVRLIVVTPINLEELSLDYLDYAIRKIDFKHSGSSIPQLTVPMIRDYEIPIPPLPEQQRIVSILDEAFAAIAKAKANAEQNLKNAKELFDVYLHKYYTSKEEGWEEKKLKEVAEYFNGLTYSPKDVSNEGIIVLRSSNVQNDELDFNDIVRVNLTVKEKIIVKDGDILMCSRNGSARLVGKTASIKNLNEEMTFGTFMMIIRSQYNPYLSWFFKSTDFRNQIKGGENTMINQITRYMLDDIVLSFPPIDKQNEIVQKLNSLSIEIKKLDTIYNQKINDLEELKKSVLQKAFSGELKTAKEATV